MKIEEWSIWQPYTPINVGNIQKGCSFRFIELLWIWDPICIICSWSCALVLPIKHFPAFKNSCIISKSVKQKISSWSQTTKNGPWVLSMIVWYCASRTIMIFVNLVDGKRACFAHELPEVHEQHILHQPDKTSLVLKLHQPDRWRWKSLNEGSNHVLISRRITPVIPTIWSNNIRHVCSGEHHSGISSPSSTKPHLPASSNAAIHKGIPTWLLHRFPSLCCDGSTYPTLQ